jgi:hypothetical protein
MLKSIKSVLAYIRAVYNFAASKEEVELLLRALVGGGALALLLSNSLLDRIAGLELTLVSFVWKYRNSKRKSKTEGGANE